jgi:hypothetical protein
MKPVRKSLLGKRCAWLAALTMLTLVTNAAMTIRLSHSDSENPAKQTQPEFRLTGMRYYLTKHNRLSLAHSSTERELSMPLCGSTDS